MALLAIPDTASSNSPPTWPSTPSPEYEDGVASNYDLLQHVSDADGDSITFTLNAGSTALPTGVTISGSNLAASSSVAEGTTAGVIIDADDGTNPKVASSSFTITTIASGAESPAPTITVRAGGSQDHTTIQAAIDAASAGDVIEVEADTPGGTEYFNEALTLPVNGTSGNEITLRGKSGDTIVAWATGKILTLTTNSYWKFGNLQFGRDETLNGWIYGTGLAEGRFAVEHERWIHAISTESSHIQFTDCTSYGGSFFDGGYIDGNSHHFKFLRHAFKYAGVNSGDGSPDRGGNNLTFRGYNSVFESCTGKFGGHDNLSVESPYIVVRKCILDGDWTTYDATNPGRGNRALTNEGSKGQSPYGPNLLEQNIIKNADDDLSSDEQSGCKHYSYRCIVRRNYIFDNEGECFQGDVLKAAGIAAADNWHIYHNTCYNNKHLVTVSDVSVGTAADSHFIDHVWKNNIASDLGAGRDGDSTHFRYVGSNSTKRGGDADDWRSAIVDNNIFHTTVVATFKARLLGDGGASKTTVSAIETEWPAVFSNNAEAAPTYTDESTRTNSDYDTAVAGFVLQGGSQGKGSASALTQANGAGSSSATLIVDDSLYFYAGADATTWDLSYFDEAGDYIKIGSNSPVQITAINYGTHTITLASPLTWSNNDNIVLVDTDGVTALTDLGANP